MSDLVVVVSRRRTVLLMAALGLMVAWAFAYFAWPRLSFEDGPFFTEPFGGNVDDLPTQSSAELRLFGMLVFVLETRVTKGNSPRTVFLLKNRAGSVQWAKAASTEFGRIRLIQQTSQWFIPGGWIVGIKPEGEESGELYLSPCGEFRFFFYSW